MYSRYWTILCDGIRLEAAEFSLSAERSSSGKTIKALQADLEEAQQYGRGESMQSSRQA